MRRRIFTLASVVSLLLFAGTVVLCVRSYWRFDSFNLTVGIASEEPWARQYTIESDRGRVLIRYLRLYVNRETDYWLNRPSGRNYVWSLSSSEVPGFSIPWGGNRLQDRHQIVPIWVFAIVFLLLPLTSTIRVLRRIQMVPLGRCRNCGYDLRATPDRCPECGTPVVRDTPAVPPSP